MNERFRTNQCIFGALYTNKQSLFRTEEKDQPNQQETAHKRRFSVSHGLGITAPKKSTQTITLSHTQTLSLFGGTEYNVRGLNTYNLIKRIIWSSVTNRSRGQHDGTSQINLPLLKGLLNEIQMELYVEDFIHKSGLRGHDPSYKEIDIYDEKGYDDYNEISDHEVLQDVLKQFAMIDPYKILSSLASAGGQQ